MVIPCLNLKLRFPNLTRDVGSAVYDVLQPRFVLVPVFAADHSVNPLVLAAATPPDVASRAARTAVTEMEFII